MDIFLSSLPVLGILLGWLWIYSFIKFFRIDSKTGKRFSPGYLVLIITIPSIVFVALLVTVQRLAWIGIGEEMKRDQALERSVSDYKKRLEQDIKNGGNGEGVEFSSPQD